MNNDSMAVLSENELGATLGGGFNSSDAIQVGGIAVGVALAVLLTPVGAGLLLCCLAGASGLAGDAMIYHGLSQSQ